MKYKLYINSCKYYILGIWITFKYFCLFIEDILCMCSCIFKKNMSTNLILK